MEPKTQLSILNNVARSTIDSVAVFRDPKNWKDFTEGRLLQSINQIVFLDLHCR